MEHLLPKSHAGTALLVGSDEILLFTRKAILQKQGYVVSIIPPDQAVAHLAGHNYGVIVACHTLTNQQADSLVKAARAKSSPPGLIGFSKDLSPISSPHPFDASVWSLATPETFIGKVHLVRGTTPVETANATR